MASVSLLAHGFHIIENGEHVAPEMHSTNERFEIAHCSALAWSIMLTTSMACAPFDDNENWDIYMVDMNDELKDGHRDYL